MSPHALQNDRWVYDLAFGGRCQSGFYVECGAWNGIISSATLGLHALGWRGMLIEANPGPAKHLARNRPDDIAVGGALYDKGGLLLPFHAANRAGYSGLVESLVPYKKEFWEAGQTVEVRSVTLTDLFVCHNVGPVVEYITLDMEGGELPALRGLDFERFTPLALSIEGRRCDEFLLERG